MFQFHRYGNFSVISKLAFDFEIENLVLAKYKHLPNLAETQTKTNTNHTNHPSEFWATNALRINKNQAFVFFTWVPRPSIIYHMWLFLTTS